MHFIILTSMLHTTLRCGKVCCQGWNAIFDSECQNYNCIIGIGLQTAQIKGDCSVRYTSFPTRLLSSVNIENNGLPSWRFCLFVSDFIALQHAVDGVLMHWFPLQGSL